MMVRATFRRPGLAATRHRGVSAILFRGIALAGVTVLLSTLTFIATGATGSSAAYAADGSDSDSDEIPPPRNRIVAQATASAATVSVAGQRHGTGQYVSEHDGSEEYTRGENAPELSLLEDGSSVVGGALGQDAASGADGNAAACAGVVGRNGTVEVGPHESCLDDANGQIELSLGTLEDLGLGDLLPDLRELAETSEAPHLPEASNLPASAELPDMELLLQGSAVTARCTATPDGVQGTTSPIDLTLVGVVDGQRIELADVPSGGGSVLLPDLVDPLVDGLPDELGTVLDPVLELLSAGDLPDLPENPLLEIVTDEQVQTDGQLRVNALRVAVLPPTLAEISIGSVTCGPNVENADGPDDSDSGDRADEPEDHARVPVSVPAGLPPSDGPGWGTAFVLAGAALVFGSVLHRRRRTT